jgi:hypothetical protein
MGTYHNVIAASQWWSILLTQIKPWTRGEKIHGHLPSHDCCTTIMIGYANAHTKWKHEHEGKTLWANVAITPWSWSMLPSHQCLHKIRPWTWTWSRKFFGTYQCVTATPHGSIQSCNKLRFFHFRTDIWSNWFFWFIYRNNQMRFRILIVV